MDRHEVVFILESALARVPWFRTQVFIWAFERIERLAHPVGVTVVDDKLKHVPRKWDTFDPSTMLQGLCIYTSLCWCRKVLGNLREVRGCLNGADSWSLGKKEHLKSMFARSFVEAHVEDLRSIARILLMWMELVLSIKSSQKTRLSIFLCLSAVSRGRKHFSF